MRAHDLLVGALMAATLLVVYPLVLALLPVPDSLEVVLPTTKPFLVAERHDELPSVSPRGGPALLSRLQSSRYPSEPGPGLSLETFRVVHGHRWMQSVTVPALVGPFARHGESQCGLSLSLGAGVFDTSGASSGVATLAKRKVDAVFPLTVSTDTPIGRFEFRLPKARTTVVRMQPGPGALAFTFRVELEDGTYLDARAKMTIEELDGAPRLRRVGDPVVRYGGASFDRLRQEARQFGFSLGERDTVWADVACAGSLGFFCPRAEAAALAGHLVDAQLPAIVHRTVAERLDEALGTIGNAMGSLLRREWAPLRSRPDVRFAFSLSSSPVITNEGVTLPLCMSATIPPPLVDASIPGSVFGSPPGAPASTSRVGPGSRIGVHMDTGALNYVLYVLWQSGVLRERGAGMIEALPASMRTLAFDWTGIEPLVPPIVASWAEPDRPEELPMVLGAVRIGRWGQRDVFAHAVARVALRTSEDVWTMSARIRELTTSCAEAGEGKSTRITSCLSDLAPLIDDAMANQPVEQSLPNADLLSRIPELAFSSLTLRLRDPRAAISSKPSGLAFSAEAEIVGADSP